eukprot:GHVU01062092.1.p1 GENE.GHVU01062092.1~~GHVU01062092.1.p1  ORF type:complete len:130 (-),score=18.25 GHVU01062092.1:885-1274(-)
MKSQTPVCTSTKATELGPLKTNKVTKTRADHLSDSEMTACFLKLKELVPTVPQNKKISKTDLLQHVIDYILDLELTLEYHPSVGTSPPQLFQFALQAERKPLAENTHLNTLQNDVDQMELECDSRPTSC